MTCTGWLEMVAEFWWSDTTVVSELSCTGVEYSFGNVNVPNTKGDK